MSAPVRLQLITSSSEKTFLRCQREYLLRYERGIRSIRTSAALWFGTLAHHCLEVWWKVIQDMQQSGNFDADMPLAAVSAFLASLTTRDVDPLDPFEHAKIHVLMVGYHYRWIDDALSNYEVLGVEVEFRAPLRNPSTGASSPLFQRAGKIDVIVRGIGSGRVYVIEHKTSTEDIGPGSDYWAKLTLNGQISRYVVGAESLGHRDVSCLYDVLRRPTLTPMLATPVEARKYTKPTKMNPEPRLYANQREADESPVDYAGRISEHIAGAPEQYFRRGEIVRLEEERAEADADCWNTAHAIRDAQRLDRWIRNDDACIRYGKRCEFHRICTRTASPDDQSLYESAQPHSELTNEQDAAVAAE